MIPAKAPMPSVLHVRLTAHEYDRLHVQLTALRRQRSAALTFAHLIRGWIDGYAPPVLAIDLAPLPKCKADWPLQVRLSATQRAHLGEQFAASGLATLTDLVRHWLNGNPPSLTPEALSPALLPRAELLTVPVWHRLL